MSTKSVREDAADRDVCPRCKAAAGEVCRTPSGKIAEMAHAGRLLKPRKDTRARERQRFHDAQGLRAVPMRAVMPRDEKGNVKSPKRAARQERRRAKLRRRGMHGV